MPSVTTPSLQGTALDPKSGGSMDDLLWTVLLALIVLFMAVLFKLLLDSEVVRDTNAARAGALFRAFFLAPDLIVFSISLLISSQVLHSILTSHSSSTYYGYRFSGYLYLLILADVVALIAVAIVWLRSQPTHKNFPTKPQNESRISAAGAEEDVVVFRLRLLHGLFRTRVGFWNLIVGNLIGFLALASYLLFIYYGFVTPPPWLH